MSKLLGHGSTNLVEALSYMRARALRKGVWFGALTQQERVLTGLIRKNVKIVKNAMLATVIARIMGKLIYAIKNSFFDKIEKLGRPIARAMAIGAYSCGNKDALNWMEDLNYIRYLGLMTYYDPMRK
ncbi:MAG: hypothetical protein ACE5KA_02510 [Nitrososphaerales archaeon]